MLRARPIGFQAARMCDRLDRYSSTLGFALIGPRAHSAGDNVIRGTLGKGQHGPYPYVFMKVRSACGLALVCEISIDHLAHQVLKSYVVVPVELGARLGAISKQKTDLRGAIELLIDDDVIVVVEAYM